MADTPRENAPTPTPIGSDEPGAIGAFEDQYTSATADFSAGGLVSAMEGNHDQWRPPVEPASTPATSTTPASAASSASTGGISPELPVAPTPTGVPATEAPSAGSIYQAQAHQQRTWHPTPTPPGAAWNPVVPEPAQPPVWRQPRSLSIGAGTAATLAAAVGGTWLFTRRQRERNKPINRLRRQVHRVGDRVSSVSPSLDDVLGYMPAAATVARPTGGMGAVALSLLVAAFLRSRRASREEAAQQAAESSADQGNAPSGPAWRRFERPDLSFDGALFPRNGKRVANGVAHHAGRFAEQASDRLGDVPVPTGQSPLFLAGLAAMAAAAFIAWRLMNRDQPMTDQDVHYYTATEAPLPNQ